MKSKILIIFLSASCSLLTDAATAMDVKSVANLVASNIAVRISGAISAKTNAVNSLASPQNFSLLKSSKLKDAAAKLALQKRLAEAALQDAEQTETGRILWHGRYISQKVDLDNLTATFTHQDGTEYTVKFRRPNISEDVEKANKRIPHPSLTNGVPKALAEARLRRHREKSDTIQVVESVEANRITPNK